jgi:quinoprotein glucose dehydrogenase
MTTSRGLASWVDPRRTEGEPCRRRILTASYDARLFALDAANGKPCPDFGREGFIDLRSGVDRIEGRRSHYNQTAPPTVIGDLVVVGSSIFDNHFADAPSGAVRAFDVRTGTLRWSWEPLVGVAGVGQDGRTVPAGAANTWATITADEDRGLLFVPTGSPSPDHYGGLRPGDNAYANSLVALDAGTGEVVWHFQTVHHDLWDYDLPAPPALITVWRNGRPIPAVAQATKMGLLFVLERDTGRPVFPVVERPVPASDVPGEVVSPTQPFPLLPRPLVPHALDPEDAWGLTPFDRDRCRDQLRALRNEGIYTPPSVRGSLAVPGFLGGMEWGGLAFSEEAGIVVTNTSRLAMAVRLVPADQYPEVAAAPGRTAQAAPQTGTPYGTVREVPVSPLGLPCSPPPWGMLHAVDASSGKVLWEVPLGTVQDLSRVPSPGAWGSPNLGGPVIAGGLVFIAASMDRRIRAFDLRTGEEVWEDVLPASGQATPLTYRARPGGRQYLAIAAGGHFGLGSALGDYIVAYALPRPTLSEDDR